MTGLDRETRVERGTRKSFLLHNGGAGGDVLRKLSECALESAGRPGLTKDRLYESKDSREILKGSSGLRMLRGLEDVVDPFDLLDQKVFVRSVGDGCYCGQTEFWLCCDDSDLTGRKSPLSLISATHQ